MTIPIPGLDHLSDDKIFSFCSNVVFIPWLALVLVPKWSWRKSLVCAVVLIQCVVYTLSFAASLGSSERSVMETFAEMSELNGVVKLFSNSAVILPAWVHYLAFDLVVGNYLVEKNLADPGGLHQALMFPVLFFTLMCGPVGVLLYSLLRTASGFLVGDGKKLAVKAS